MPDPFKLTKLTEVRKAAGVTLAQMARACGYTGTGAMNPRAHGNAD